jgi:hypothetical protein
MQRMKAGRLLLWMAGREHRVLVSGEGAQSAWLE